jgi:nicotinamide mononucleotide adenylyltransferase
MARQNSLNRKISLDSASFGPAITSNPSSSLPSSPYSFPTHKLKTQLQGTSRYLPYLHLDPKKIPLVIVACGSYSPITYLHLRMFEMGYDYIADSDTFEIVGGYFSPVSDAYAKPGLAPWYHRVDMCSLAVRDSSWIMVDSWEPSQPTYVRTARVLDHFNEYLNGSSGGVLMPDGMLIRKLTKESLLISYFLKGSLY